MKKLIELIKEFDLNQTDKHNGHSYIEYFYEDFFKPYRNKKLNILEIGTREGDSLRLWKEAFPKSKIYGVDNALSKRFKDIQEDRIYFHFGDAYTQEMCDSFPNFDIIIDDGPHTLDSQIKCLELYLPKLNDSGFIVIEDIADFNYVEILEKKYIELGGNKEVEFYDMRSIKNRFDDIIVTFKK